MKETIYNKYFTLALNKWVQGRCSGPRRGARTLSLFSRKTIDLIVNIQCIDYPLYVYTLH